MPSAPTPGRCAHCGKPLPARRRIDKRSCGPSCRAMASQARHAEALQLFLAGSQLRASGDFDLQHAAALDRQAARLLGVEL